MMYIIIYNDAGDPIGYTQNYAVWNLWSIENPSRTYEVVSEDIFYAEFAEVLKELK